MNLLHVIASLNPANGGVAQAVRLVIPPLQSQGCENEVICLDDPDLAKTWSDGFTVHALGASRGPWAYHPDLIPWLEANLDRFDAVIVHGLWLFPSYAVWKRMRRKLKAESGKLKEESRKQKAESKELKAESRKLKAEGRKLKSPPPYYIFPHGMLDPWFQKAPERRLKALRNWVYWKLVESKVIRDAAGLLFTCEEERRLAQTTFAPYAPQQEINVGYGIAEPPVWKERMRTAFAEKCPELQGRHYLLFLSRIHPKKGVDLLIRAYAKLVAETSSAPIPDLVIAGPGLETAYGQEMQQLAAELAPSPLSTFPQIHFPGMLSGDAKWGAFYGCEAFVLPSHQENFGIAVVEALACGKPVLISDQVNIWREIENAKAGLIAPDTDLGTFELLENWNERTQAQRDEMSQSARRAYVAHFGIAGAAGNLLEALRVDDRLKQEITL